MGVNLEWNFHDVVLPNAYSRVKEIRIRNFRGAPLAVDVTCEVFTSKAHREADGSPIEGTDFTVTTSLDGVFSEEQKAALISAIWGAAYAVVSAEGQPLEGGIPDEADIAQAEAEEEE